MAEGEGNLGQQHRNISAVDVLETSRQTRIELTNILESILRQLQSENVDENVVDSVQYRLDWIFVSAKQIYMLSQMCRDRTIPYVST